MASDRLFEMLAQAKANPSHALRAVEAAGTAGNDILGGYAQGLGIKRQMNEYPLELAGKKSALYDHMSKLAEQYGPDKAAEIMSPVFKSVGLEMPSSQFSGSGANYTPEQLSKMPGTFAKNELDKANTYQKMQETGPRDPVSVKSNLIASGMEPLAADAWISANTDQAGKVQNKNYEDLIKGITAKNQGMRMEGMADYFHTKSGTMNLQQLPSEMGPNTTPGAAAQVLIGAKMGKSLIAKPGSPQRTAAARADAARTIVRKSPTDEALKTMDYTGNLSQRWAVLKQNLTSDPDSVDNPNIRKDMYDLFNDMQNAAMPFVSNHLSNRESFGLATPPTVRQREMGLNIPDIPFDAGGNVPSGRLEFATEKDVPPNLPIGTKINVGGKDATWQ